MRYSDSWLLNPGIPNFLHLRYTPCFKLIVVDHEGRI